MQDLYKRFKGCINKTYKQFGDGIGRLFLGKKQLSVELYAELEKLLISADIGINAVKKIIQNITLELKRDDLVESDVVLQVIKKQLMTLLAPADSNLLEIINNHVGTFVILVVGVNGTGKTTTIAKLANFLQKHNKKVMLAAGDTFRAAAIEQLKFWGQKCNIPVISQHIGADSASVIYDALYAAKARNIDVLIADTAGRLHTQNNLMDELKKIKRVMRKLDPQAPHEVMLVLDASIGQNALNQAKEFYKIHNITGITMTKLDGTAKGGVLFALVDELKLPLRYLGIGEGIDDLQLFNSKQFIEAIFDNKSI